MTGYDFSAKLGIFCCCALVYGTFHLFYCLQFGWYGIILFDLKDIQQLNSN